MIDVKSASSTTTSSVVLTLTGAPPLKVLYTNRQIDPGQVFFKYEYVPTTTEDGWTEHTWKLVSVRATGARILKPAADGSQRLGVEMPAYEPVRLKDVPEWLLSLAREVRPSGSVDEANV